jgi:hypothetical protein
MAAGVSKQLGLCGASNNTQLEQTIPGELTYVTYSGQVTVRLTTRRRSSMVLQHCLGRKPHICPNSIMGLYTRLSTRPVH